MDDLLPDTFKPTPEYEGLRVRKKALVWHAGGTWMGHSPLGPKLQQRVCGEPAGNIASDSGLLQGPLLLVGFGSTEGHTKAGRSGQAPIGCLRARFFDAASCNAGHQGRASGFRIMHGANSSELLLVNMIPTRYIY
eukprot:1156448-Pelagomonas_calceolata.AAC.5